MLEAVEGVAVTVSDVVRSTGGRWLGQYLGAKRVSWLHVPLDLV